MALFKLFWFLVFVSLILFGCGDDSGEDDFIGSISTMTLLGRIDIEEGTLPTLIRGRITDPALLTDFKVTLFRGDIIEAETQSDSNGQFAFTAIRRLPNYLIKATRGRLSLFYFIDSLPAQTGTLGVQLDLLSTGKALVINQAIEQGKNLNPQSIKNEDLDPFITGFKNILTGSVDPGFLTDSETIDQRLISQIEESLNRVLNRSGGTNLTENDLNRALPKEIDRNGDGNPDSLTQFNLSEGVGPFGQKVFYYDFTPNGLVGGRHFSRQPQNLYQLKKGGSKAGPLIFSKIPGESGYSDFGRIIEVELPETAPVSSLTSSEEVEKSGFTLSPTEMVINAVMVPEGSQLTGDPQVRNLQSGWYSKKRVHYFLFETNQTDSLGRAATSNKIYIPDPLESHSNQKNIFSYLPGETPYGDLGSIHSVATTSLMTRLSDIFNLFHQEDKTKTGILIDIETYLTNNPIVKIEDEKVQNHNLAGRANSFERFRGRASNGNPVYYYDFGPTLASGSYVYQFKNNDGSESNLKPVFPVVPGDSDYSDFFRIREVTLDRIYHSDSFKSEADLMASGLTYATTSLVLNLPIVPSGSILKPNINSIPLSEGWSHFKKVFYFKFNQTQMGGGELPLTSPFLEIDPALADESQLDFFSGLPGETGFSDLKVLFEVVLATPTLTLDVLSFATTRNPVDGGFTANGGAVSITASTTFHNIPIVQQVPLFSSLYSQILSPKCAAINCHSGGNPAEGLSLSTGGAYSNLVGINSIQNPEKKLVRGENPQLSYLLDKLKGSGVVGKKMPLNSNPLSQKEIEDIESWINEGALNL